MDTLERMRRMLFGVLLSGMAGVAAELLLTSHTEDAWQWAPLILIFAAFPLTLLVAWRRAPTALAAMRGLMALFIAAGALGTWFHYESNAEFVAELSPGLGGVAFLAEAFTRPTPPPLAPGAMIMLGLLGWICCYRPAAPPARRLHGE